MDRHNRHLLVGSGIERNQSNVVRETQDVSVDRQTRERMARAKHSADQYLSLIRDPTDEEQDENLAPEPIVIPQGHHHQHQDARQAASAMASSIPESYTPAQLSAYLSHISFSPPLAQGPDLTYLTVLQARQVARVPFEDLSLHYSPTHTISLDPVVLFDKIVHRGRGGYCMENNMLFGQMLAALGYDVYFAGARISERLTGSRGAEAQDFGGWSHMVNIVTIQNMRYVVDVGFGAGGSIRPMPLVDGAESQGLGTQMLRLAYRRLRQHRDPTQRAWVLETRGEDENGEEWKPIYAFTTVEFLPSDFSVMNLATSTLRTSWFTYTVVCARMLLSEAGDEVIGNLTLVNRDLKRNIRGKKELLVTCQSEEERLAVLEEHFGIVLREDERGGIAGLGTALR